MSAKDVFNTFSRLVVQFPNLEIWKQSIYFPHFHFPEQLKNPVCSLPSAHYHRIQFTIWVSVHCISMQGLVIPFKWANQWTHHPFKLRQNVELWYKSRAVSGLSLPWVIAAAYLQMWLNDPNVIMRLTACHFLIFCFSQKAAGEKNGQSRHRLNSTQSAPLTVFASDTVRLPGEWPHT